MTEKWRKSLDENLFLDFRKAFDLNYKVIEKKLMACGIIGDCMNG